MGILAIRVGVDAQNRFYFLYLPGNVDTEAIQEATPETSLEATQTTKKETIPEAAKQTFPKTCDNDVPLGVPPAHGRLFETN